MLWHNFEIINKWKSKIIVKNQNEYYILNNEILWTNNLNEYFKNNKNVEYKNDLIRFGEIKFKKISEYFLKKNKFFTSTNYYKINKEFMYEYFVDDKNNVYYNKLDLKYYMLDDDSYVDFIIWNNKKIKLIFKKLSYRTIENDFIDEK